MRTLILARNGRTRPTPLCEVMLTGGLVMTVFSVSGAAERGFDDVVAASAAAGPSAEALADGYRGGFFWAALPLLMALLALLLPPTRHAEGGART